MRTSIKILMVLAAFAVAATSIPAMAAKGHGSAKLVIKGGSSIKVNKFEKDSVHWVPGTITIASGGTLTISNKSPDHDPHTFSVVNKPQLPRTQAQFEECGVCGEIAKAHGVNPSEPPSGPPPIPTVDPGNDGFNAPGDSQVIGPHQTLHVTITAKPGTKLYFICAVHPWMQGVVKVIK
jgi:hypothetical protein